MQSSFKGTIRDFSSKRTRLSLVMWALIHNNIIRQNMYMILIGVDFIYQLLIMLSIFFSFDELEIADDNIARQIVELHSMDISIQIIEILIISGYLAALIAVIIVLILKPQDSEYFKDNKIMFKILSLSFAFLRSILFTVIIQNLAIAFNNYK